MKTTALPFLCAVLALGVFSPFGAAAKEASPSASGDAQLQDEAARLIRRLGSDDFAQRESAARKLIAIGVAAYEPLVAGAEHTDAEIRYRSKRILEEVRRRDFHRRLRAFADNVEADERYDLPGWSAYRRLVGDRPEARDLFVKMQTEAPRLMQALEEGPQMAGQALNLRCLQALQPFGDSGEKSRRSLGDAAAILFVAAQDDTPLSDFASSGVYRVCVDQSMRRALADDAQRNVLRTLLATWIGRESDSGADYQKLNLALQYDLKEGLTRAVEILEEAGQPPHLRQQAICTVAKFGDASHLPILERRLDDETKCGARRLDNRRTLETQVRDVALAALVHLTGQDHSAYGMEHIVAASPFVFVPYTCGFENDADRRKALARWREYRAQEPPFADPG